MDIRAFLARRGGGV